MWTHFLKASIEMIQKWPQIERKKRKRWIICQKGIFNEFEKSGMCIRNLME